MNRRSTNFPLAREALLKADTYLTATAETAKGALWLVRTGAALRENGTTWSKFASKLKKKILP